MESSEIIRARHIARPINEAFSCSPESDCLDVLGDLRERQFDYCPVVDDGIPVGLLAASDCKEGRRVRDIARTIEIQSIIAGDTDLLDVARKLLLVPFQFILDGSHLSGFVTEADLGSATGKSFAYVKVAAVEVGLCKYLRSCYPDTEQALLVLGEKRQSELSDRINHLKTDDQFIDHLAACGLADLLQIAGRQQEFRASVTKFGGWGRLTGGLPDLRNDIMHPDLPLLGKRRTLRKFVDKIQHLNYLQEATQICLRKQNGIEAEIFEF
jgi:hypothetical protein